MSPDFDRLLLHKRTRSLLEIFIQNPAHALLLIGPEGSGKKTTAQAIAARLLALSPDALDSYPFFLHVRKDKDSRDISIDSVRQIIKTLSLKVPVASAIKRVVYIEDSDRLSLEAQNSLLKVLEEPPAGCVFTLTAPTDQVLLPTISSRMRKVTISPLGLTVAKDYYAEAFTEAEIESAWRLSQGSAGLLHALLQDNELHPLKDAVNNAKQLLKQSPYERYQSLESVKDKEQLGEIMDALSRVLSALNQAAIDKGSVRQSQKILAGRKLIYELKEKLAANANPRLIFMKLVLNLHL